MRLSNLRAWARLRPDRLRNIALALLIVCAGSVPAFADCLPSPPHDGGTVTCSGNLPNYDIANLGVITVNVASGTNFNGPFTATNIGTMAMNTLNSNMGAMTFTNVGTLALNLSGGNVNGPISISGASSVTVNNTVNLNQFTVQASVSFILDNNGNLNNGLVFTGTGDTHITNHAGRSINSPFTITGDGDHTVDNFGTLNNGLIITGDGDIVVGNGTGAFINNSFQLIGDGDRTILNVGTINNGIVLSGNGTSSTTNEAGATINNGIVSTGSSLDTVDNSGTIQGGTFSLGDGNDQLIQRAGTINEQVQLGNGADGFNMLGGTINGSVHSGAGADTASVNGGKLTGTYFGEDGNDRLAWRGGTVGAIDMGAGDDGMRMISLPSSSLGTTDISGGLGIDVLQISNTDVDLPQRLRLWESVNLLSGSSLFMGTDLVLGDSVSQRGALSIDSSSSVLAGNGQFSILPFNAGSLVTVANSGFIDLLNDGDSTTDTLTIRGNYVGRGGLLGLNTVVEADGAPSDRLVIDGGEASGDTRIRIVNNGGLGALTEGNGILVVDTVNGGLTSTTSFRLASEVAAGPYLYTLRRGGIDGTRLNNWYLTSAVDCVTDPNNPVCPPIPPDCLTDPNNPDCPPPVPPDCSTDPTNPDCRPSPPPICETDPTDPSCPPIPPPICDTQPRASVCPPVPPPLPDFRPDVSIDAALSALALAMGSQVLDSLHERVGEDRNFTPDNATPFRPGLTWGRVIGMAGTRDGGRLGILAGGGTYGYVITGAEAGIDLYATANPDDSTDQAGLYGALSEARGTIIHFEGVEAGEAITNGASLGGYWTHYGAEGWYIDALVQGTVYGISGLATTDFDLFTTGYGFAGSIEGGYPLLIGDGWIVEPQLQLKGQAISIASTNDGAADVSFSDDNSLIGRLGVRVGRDFVVDTPAIAMTATGWVRASVLDEFLGRPKTTFSSGTISVPFTANISGPSALLNAGIDLTIAPDISLYGSAGYARTFDGAGQSTNLKLGLKGTF